MKDIYVKFETVEEILAFVDTVDRHKGPCSLKLGPYLANAKSVLSIVGMDLSKPLLFECGGDLNIILQITPYVSVAGSLEQAALTECVEKERIEEDVVGCSSIRRIINRFYDKWNQRAGQSAYGG